MHGWFTDNEPTAASREISATQVKLRCGRVDACLLLLGGRRVQGLVVIQVVKNACF